MVAGVERGTEGGELLFRALDLGHRRDLTGLEVRLQDHGARRAEFNDLFEQDGEDIF